MATFKFFKDYFFYSDEKYSALLLLLGIIATVVGTVATLSLFGTWSIGFWAALVAKDMALYMASIQTFVLLTAVYIGVSVLKDYLIGVLTIRWRNWLTTHFLEKYASDGRNNYLDLSRAQELENPAQRIQDDINLYVEQGLSLSISLLQSIITIVTFITTLWVVGGSITIASITIPGYLVWVAIAYAVLATGLTHLIGRPLARLANEQQDLEAEFRSEMEHLANNAESIAQEHGEAFYQQSLRNRLDEINRNSYRILGIRINITALNSFLQQISSIFPYILAAPLYFSGGASIGMIMEVGFSFSQIQASLGLVSTSYEFIIRFFTSASRLDALEASMNHEELSSQTRIIQILQTPSSDLSVHHLDITVPSNREQPTPVYIMRDVNLTFHPGENTLIKGRSGLGKSTIFKAMAGTWDHGGGEVFVPDNHRLYFLPQKPSLPHDTLKVVLAYPEPVETYRDDQYDAALRDVGDMDDFIPKLNCKENWSTQLSAGQQQRILFARALLKRPDILFLDESTSALDEECEAKMYTLLQHKLPSTTYISIGHRSTIAQFHDRVITLTADEDRTVHYDEVNRFARSYA